MQIIKDFYLLGRGELYQVFIDHAQHMLKTPPTAVTEHGAWISGIDPYGFFFRAITDTILLVPSIYIIKMTL